MSAYGGLTVISLLRLQGKFYIITLGIERVKKLEGGGGGGQALQPVLIIRKQATFLTIWVVE